MNKENSVVLTGTYKTEQVTATFEKTMISFASKDKEGQWKDGNFEMYLKPELAQQSGIALGDTIKVKGFLVFNFFTKQDGTQMSFPKLIATEVLEVEKAGAAGNNYAAAPQQPQAQPQGYAAPAPGAAPQAPGMIPDPSQGFGAPPVPPMPGQIPQAPQ